MAAKDKVLDNAGSGVASSHWSESGSLSTLYVEAGGAKMQISGDGVTWADLANSEQAAGGSVNFQVAQGAKVRAMSTAAGTTAYVFHQ